MRVERVTVPRWPRGAGERLFVREAARLAAAIGGPVLSARPVPFATHVQLHGGLLADAFAAEREAAPSRLRRALFPLADRLNSKRRSLLEEERTVLAGDARPRLMVWSGAARSRLAEVHGVPAGAVFVSRPGVEQSLFSPGAQAPVEPGRLELLFAGRPFALKGLATAIEVLGLLVASGRDACLDVAGADSDGRAAFREGGGAFLDTVAAPRESLSPGRYDLAVDLQGLLRSSLVTVLSGAAVRVGRGRWPWLHRSVPMYDHGRTPHAVENTARALEPLGVDLDGFFAAGLAAVASLARELVLRGEALASSLSLPRPFVALLPASSRASRRLSFAGIPLPGPAVVLGGPDARGLGPPGAVDLAGSLPLLDSASLSLVASRAYGADTGPSHLAALLGAPITGVHGPTRLARAGLRGPRARNVGAPCGGCERRRCPRAKTCLAEALRAAVGS